MITFTEITSIIGIGLIGFIVGRVAEKIILGKKEEDK